MALEIERKFLLANDAWKDAVVGSERMRDGLIGRFGGGKVRIRQTAEAAWITVKGPRQGISRSEFEYEIPRDDAEEMLRTLCRGPILEKIRHSVPHEGFVWAVDIHTGPLAGVAFAEVELSHPEQHLPLPSWIGKEVTHNPRFRKSALMRRWIAAAKAERFSDAGALAGALARAVPD